MRHECEVCGVFGTSYEARDDYLGADRVKTTRIVRTTLSHWVRQRQAIRNNDNIPLVTSVIVEAALSGELSIPNPAEQATNIINFIGDETKTTGKSLENMSPEFHSSIGSISREFSYNLLFDLKRQGFLDVDDASTQEGLDAYDIRLTLDGWNRYDSQMKGQTAGNYGFIALKFGDPVLDPFLRNHIKPAIESLGMQLRDMRDSARAGIIDNLMRMEIRESAFVLVDLTHDNSGAYWEAGYAEGLGKPVLYICEKSKFDDAKTHFDTNHCTTVLWDSENPDDFKDSLLATLKRSLLI